MKRFVFILAILVCGVALADTITINWLNEDKTVSSTSTCTVGGDVILPNTPTKYGYTFQGWTTKYIPIEYLESTGTQYIDTGFIPNNNTGVKTKIQIIGGKYTLFGSAVAYDDKAYEAYIWKQNIEFNYGNSYVFSQTTINDNDIIVIDWDKNIINYSVNNEVKPRFVLSNSAFTSPYTMHIFANKRPNGIGGTGNIKLYYFQIYNNNTLVRDFIPVLDGNGTPCMYDKVEKKFYYNQGTGQFIAGPVLTE